MPRQKAPPTPMLPRLTIPPLIGGDWDTVIIWTYGADLAFFEDDLWRQLERTRNRILFADASQVDATMGPPGAAPAPREPFLCARTRERRPAAHAKLIMLLRA